MYRLMVLWVVLITIACRKSENSAPASAETADYYKIWDKGKHNAFTDLIEYKSVMYCAFREGDSHTSYDGILRIIKSKDGVNWTDIGAAVIDSLDLRDPKFYVDKNGDLNLSGYARNTKNRGYNFAWKFNNGVISKPHNLSVDDYWLWRYTKFGNTNYSIGYLHTKASNMARLYLFLSSDSGYAKYQVLASDQFNKGCPSEASLAIGKDSVAYVSLRDDCANGSYIGRSKYPFSKWEWIKLKFPVRGPCIVILPSGKLALAAGSMDDYNQTYLAILDPARNCQLESLTALPSAGDTGYPGLVIKNNMLWISYYSYDNGKTRIFIKKIKL